MKISDTEIVNEDIHRLLGHGKPEKRPAAKGKRKKTVMTREHPRWDEFCNRMDGPEGCNFRQDEKGEWTWDCNSDHSFATAILESMGGLDIPASIEYFEDNSGFCDCEILFNIDRETE